MAQCQIPSLLRGALLRRVRFLTPSCSSACGLKTTSQKQDLTPQLPEPRISAFEKPILPDLTEEQKKNWISYGWSIEDKAEDRAKMHGFFFATITILIVCGGFAVAYGPDHRLKHWAHREAFLELRRREKLGMPLINKDFINPEYLILPSDEELGDTKIIV